MSEAPEPQPVEQAEAAAAPPFSLDDEFLQDPQAASLRGAPKCLGLFIIVAIVYFFNLYCMIYVLPDVRQKFTEHQIALDGQQERFFAVSARLKDQKFLGYLPVLVIMALGIGSLVTRWWNVFSGLFFTLIVLQFLLFLYGWVKFALPLIQLRSSV